jgi:zinc transport system ATP-binding protein
VTDCPAVSIDGVTFSFGRHRILDNATVTIPQRDFVCMVGPNGGGKTTLLKLILGLLEPAGGRIEVFGKSPVKARPRVGYMPQHAALDPLFPVNVMDVVLMGRLGPGRRFGPYRGTDKAAAREAIQQVGLEDLRNRHLSELSGGQRQRVLIARALASEPDLLILDEPDASLDPRVQIHLYDLLVQLNERLTVIMVTHDIGVVSQAIKGVICVNRHVSRHDTAELTGEVISNLYGGDVQAVSHDHGHHHGHGAGGHHHG